MTPALPRSALMAWVLTGWLRGRLSTDDAIDWLADRMDVLGDGGRLVDMLALVRRSGASGAGVALPREGDLLGLGGPAELNAAALAAGEAVVLTDLGLVPTVAEDVAVWTVHPAHRRQVVDIGEADRQLRSVLLTTTDELVRLDIARWRPEVADELMDLHRTPELSAPDGTPPRCVALAARGLAATHVVALALADDGAAVSSAEADLRRTALAGLERAARTALVAACSWEAWP